MIRKFGAALVAAFLFASPAVALKNYSDHGPVVVAQNTATQSPTIIVPPTNDSIVTPDGKGGVVVSVGSMAGQFWVWFIGAFGAVIVAILVTWIRKGMAKMGVEMTASQEAELSRALQDGFNHAATTGEQLIAGKLPIEVKDPNAAAAIQYVIKQKGALIKAMGLDPNSGDVVRMLQAKLATLKADPSTPTVVETQIVTTKPALDGETKSKIV